ncbi:tryptophan synthase subunit alpha [Ralstonia pseudosolanacearum]|uniref:Tryptophan synthase alpha chain n=1 Tax=Ralstonia solanacearum TaxID=305 RepID=A0AA92JRK1_RALSL|nr:tryptophan synthase subunit alpha [Ralstonia pseudosolanacearum]QOK91428.1 tryptophan synthase subunit alpha [Ralstonia pseudosolanacearum]QOK96307.1 tryptophan synthase subunit alpha [Ralstonia pseudosolanacearum]UWD89825.1 tryptophan synthase subunit alpha [Ralstonia pseudosolanacearum]CAH0439445.1 Tryptophan synthase alpha chain [Ralstonia pseudosolanacearum]
MSRIAQTFSQLSAQGRKGLIPFITAGDPYPELTVDLMHALVKGGANVIELGVPFSDPMADGPVIQRASERALAKKIGLRTVLDYVRAFRATDKTTPVVLMGYANPIERMGIDAFAKAASEAGVDGVLVVDYPPEECEAFAKTMQAVGIDPIFLLAPTSTEARMAQIARVASGYIYYVSLKGVTGAATLDLDSVAARIPQIRQHARLPVGVGFGIRDAATARAIGGVADAVVIGSRIVQLLEEASREQAVQCLTDFIADIRQALDA